jgi:hypothetical protein
LGGKGLWVKENLGYGGCVLIFSAKFPFRFVKISGVGQKKHLKIIFSYKSTKIGVPLANPHVPQVGSPCSKVIIR